MTRPRFPPARGAALAALALLVSACASMAPVYQRPPSPAPAAFPAGPAYPPPAAAGPTAPQIGWRSFFTDPKLRSLIEIALRNNRDLRVSILNIAEARQQYRIQAAAELPTLGGSAAVLREHEPTEVALGSVGSAFPGAALPKNGLDFQEYSASIGISDYELDLWGRVRSLKKAALEQYLSTVEAKREAEITLISEVATDVLTFAADAQRLKVAQETLKADQTTLDLTQARFSGGVASLLDVRQAETALEQARTAVAVATTTCAQDVNALTLVVGAPVPREDLPQGLGDALPTLGDVPAGLSSEVLLNRPDVLEAEHQLKAYNADIGAARAAFFPTLTLTGSGGSASISLSHLFNAANGAWMVEPNLSLPIFAGGANVARLRYAKEQKEAAIASYEKAVQTAFREVADALAQRGTIEAQLSSQERLVAAASSSLDLSLARYRRGADPFLNTLTSQLALYSAQQSLISARLTRATNLVTLYRTLGGGVLAGPEGSGGPVHVSPTS